MAAPVLHLTSSELHARFKKVTLSPSETASQTQGIVIACFPLYDEYNMGLTICRRLLHKVGILEAVPYTLLTLDMTTYKKRGAGKYHSWSSFVGETEYRVLQEVSKKGPYCTYCDVFVMEGARAVYVGTSNCVYGLAPVPVTSPVPVPVTSPVPLTSPVPVTSPVLVPAVPAVPIVPAVPAVPVVPAVPTVPTMYIKENDNYSNKTISEDSEEEFTTPTKPTKPTQPTKPAFVPVIPMNKVTPKSYKDMGAM
jgi:hypothetical protein